MKTCVVAIAKEEDPYIEEWINYNLKLGFNDIFIWTNDWTYTCLNKNVFIDTISGFGKQLESYNTFIRNEQHKYNWVAFFDIDEFLVLKKHTDIRSFLYEYNDCNSIGINWSFFGNNNQTKVLNNNYSVLKRFTKRSKQTFIGNNHIKSIVKLPIDNCVGVHNITNEWYNLNKEKRNGPYNTPVDWKIAQLNHYFSKTDEELYLKCLRGRADLVGVNNTKVCRKFEDHKRYLYLNDEEDTLAKDFLYKRNDDKNV